MTEQEQKMIDKYGAGFVSLEEIEDIYKEVEKCYEVHLSQHGVHSLNLRNKAGFTCGALQLVLLFKYSGKLVDKDYISEIVRMFIPDARTDQQPRHLWAKGWDVLGSGKSFGTLRYDTSDLKGNTYKANTSVPSGMYILYQGSVSPEFKTKHTRKTRVVGILTDNIWNGLLNDWNHGCALCGKIGCSLEKGHLDPRRPLTADNTVPMCSSCNNWASDDWTFNIDNNSRVRILHPNNAKFIENCPDDVISKIAANKTIRAIVGRRGK